MGQREGPSATATPAALAAPPPRPAPARAARQQSLVATVATNLGYFGLSALLFYCLALAQQRPYITYDVTTFQWHAAVGPLPSPLLFLALTPPLVYLSTLVHECGHVVASLFVGRSIYYCRIGAFTVTRTRQGVRLGVSRGKTLGGLMAAYPRDERFPLMQRAVVVAAGPLASLLLALAAWRLANALAPHSGTLLLIPLRAAAANGPTLPMGTLLAASACLFMAVEAGLSGLSNLFPHLAGGQPNDGLLLLRTLTSPAAARRQEALSALRGYLFRDVRARDWPVDLIARALPPLPDGSALDVYASLMAYAQALDAGDIATARVFLNRFLAPAYTLREGLPVIALEGAYFIARYWGDPLTARAWLALGRGAAHEAFLRPRAEAAILLAEGRSAEAYERATQGLAHLLTLRPSLSNSMREEEDSLRAMQAAAAVSGGSGQPFSAG
jgi:hypothetical protein